MEKLDQIIADMPRRCAVAELVGYCNGIIKSGALSDVHSAYLRDLLTKTRVAFEMKEAAQ